MYNSKNYTEQGGEKSVFNGIVEFGKEAVITGLPIVENQADSTATDIQGLLTDFNALLAKLKSAGLMESDS